MIPTCDDDNTITLFIYCEPNEGYIGKIKTINTDVFLFMKFAYSGEHITSLNDPQFLNKIIVYFKKEVEDYKKHVR